MRSISFVIPVRPGCYPTKALEHIAALNYPTDLLEVVLVEGSQPSRQRNYAVENASGEVIYFLDDDSFISADALNEGLKFIDMDKIGAVGGPALTHTDASFLERIFGEVVGSYFGTGPTRARNKAIGEAREVRGEELILCNMMIPKKVFETMSGLNIDLYPNEENELLKRMRAAGFRFFYVPQMKINRTKRDSVMAFVKQMFSYGDGRGRHILRRFTWPDLSFFAPTAFCLYLLSLIFFNATLFLIPLAIYLTFISIGCFLIACRQKCLTSGIAALPFFPIMHICYGLGMLSGICRFILGKHNKTKSDSIPVTEKTLKPKYGTT